MSGGVEPRLPPLDPGCLPPPPPPFLPPRLFLPPPPRLSALPPPPPPRWAPLMLLEGFELVVETTDSAGELAPDSWARLSRRAAVSPSVKLESAHARIVTLCPRQRAILGHCETY